MDDIEKQKLWIEITVKIKELFNSYHACDRNENKCFMDFSNNGNPYSPLNKEDHNWELGNRSGKWSMLDRISKQFIDILQEQFYKKD